MSFSAGALVAADPRITGVTGIRGLGFSRLQFTLTLELRTHAGYVLELSNLSGRVSAGNARPGPFLPLGKLAPETSWFAQTESYSRAEQLGLLLDLTSEQLEALERLRGGGPLFFEFDLRVQVRTQGKSHRGFDTILFEATLSDWSKVLQDLGYLELLVLAMELPIGASATLKAAVVEVRKAHQDLIAGRYDSTVARCRMAMDALDAVVPCQTSPDDLRRMFAGNRETREAMSKTVRADLVRNSVRHYTQLAHHVDSNGEPESFSRQDALFILTAAGGVIWQAVTAPRGPV